MARYLYHDEDDDSPCRYIVAVHVHGTHLERPNMNGFLHIDASAMMTLDRLDTHDSDIALVMLRDYSKSSSFM